MPCLPRNRKSRKIIMSEVVKTYRCPICRKLVSSDNKYRPFCSKRCADIDLGNWFSESYRVPVVELDEQDIKYLSEEVSKLTGVNEDN